MAFLKAEKNISSAADKFVQNPFGDDYEYVKDLVRSDFVFLQHGVTKDDMSSWLKRWNKDIKLLCCASIREQQSFVENEKYGYSDAVVKLTGFARHDKLINAKEPSKKRLLIAPTWRKYLAGELEPSTGKFLRNPAFKESDYFAFYSKLLNDAQIALALEAQGFETHFLLHPAFLNNLGDFSSSYAQIQSEYNYAKEFVESSIMITDYSSVAFDFAILKKPLLYAQFDKERFYETQWDRGYFDYEADGFGPVCLDYDSLKENLLHILENPAMDSEYSGRVDSFFGPLDGKACERILNELRNMINVR